MITLTGKKVSEGIEIGRLAFYKRGEKEIRRIYVEDVTKEILRFQKAREKAVQEIKELCEISAKETGEATALIFEMQQMVLEDSEFLDSVTRIVMDQRLNAEYAVQKAAENFLAEFATKDSSYVRGHEADVKDVASRLLRILGEEKRRCSWMNLSSWRQGISIPVKRRGLIRQRSWGS